MKTALFVGLVLVAIPYLVALVGAAARARAASRSGEDAPVPTALGLAVGFVTNFFDTLGIGSFAPTTAIFKLRGLVRDERIPGTLNVGHTPPTIAQALIFIAIVNVDVWTLTLMIVAAVAGSWLGASVVSGWPRRNIQIGMGGALLVAATLFLLTIFGVAPGGGEALALSGTRLAIGLGVNFVLGALMEVGVGLYGPCLILVSLLGMNPQAAFPIMMGSCAFLMPIGSLKFIRSERYSLRASLGLGIGGVPAVLIAAFIVKSLPLLYLRWLVVVVVLYAALSMLRSAFTESRVPAEKPAA
ncbi:MAG TPA: sulfite exporter TauE/SafE family protein [Vicinamibacteria bacterium]|jgi:uncharacterized membrane protein YfcA